MCSVFIVIAKIKAINERSRTIRKTIMRFWKMRREMKAIKIRIRDHPRQSLEETQGKSNQVNLLI